MDHIPINGFTGTVIIFHGVDVISDKRIRVAVYNLLSHVLNIGRRFKSTCLMTNQFPSNKDDTRCILHACPIF